MPTYAYRCRDSRGRVIQGRVDADSERGAVQALRGRGLIVTGLEEVRGAGAPPKAAPRVSAPPSASPGAPTPLAGVGSAGGAGTALSIDVGEMLSGFLVRFRPHRVSLRALNIFCRQFSSILEAGIPILNGLKMMSQEIEEKELAEALRAIAADLERGHTLSEAVEARGDFFPPLFRHTIPAGEQGGFLEETFRRLADHFEKEDNLNQKISSATLYPKVVATAAVLIVLGILAFILPNFADIFADMEIEIPASTRLVLAASDLVRNYWYLLPVPVIGAYLGLRAFAASPGGRRRLDDLALRAPIFGPLNQKRALAVFGRTLGTLLQGGVPILTALALVEQTLENVVLEDVVRRSAADAREGGGLLKAMRESPYFPRIFVEMLGVGEETGRMEEMLHRVSDFYEKDVERTAERLTTMIEPLIIVFLGGIVALILLSVFIPLFSIYEGF